MYFCCLEALQNTVKHGGSQATADVHVFEHDGALSFEISDTGTGFEATTASDGAGMTNMRDRLEAIGGTLHVHSAPGEGTLIRGSAGAILTAGSAIG